MTKNICKQCGNAVTEGTRFCTYCGALAGSSDTANISALETRPLPREQTDQPVPIKAGVTEELAPARKAPSDYDTEELPQTKITAQAEEKTTTVVADAPVTQSQMRSAKPASPALAKQPSGGRKGLLLAAALGVVALAAGSFFLVNSRRSSETQAANQPADKAKPAASAQPSGQPSDQPSDQLAGQPSGANANNQTQPQLVAAPGEVKSPAAQDKDAGSKAQQTRGAEKPAPAASQEQKAADGTGGGAHNLNQGVAHLSAGRYQDALREFEYVKKLDPGNRSVYYLIGQAYHKMNQLERALEAYRQCTSGVYASIAQTHVKTLEKRLGKTY